MVVGLGDWNRMEKVIRDEIKELRGYVCFMIFKCVRLLVEFGMKRNIVGLLLMFLINKGYYRVISRWKLG